jgi:hypothetical protein
MALSVTRSVTVPMTLGTTIWVITGLGPEAEFVGAGFGFDVDTVVVGARLDVVDEAVDNVERFVGADSVVETNEAEVGESVE